jgi:hypothetical protein
LGSAVGIGWRGIQKVENLRTIRIQASTLHILIAANKQVGSQLIDGLFENVERAIAI